MIRVMRVRAMNGMINCGSWEFVPHVIRLIPHGFPGSKVQNKVTFRAAEKKIRFNIAEIWHWHN
jgi:hypothetical protein